MVNEDLKSLPPGAISVFMDELPLLTTAHIRPYVIAILLHRGAVKGCEIIASLVTHCQTSDLKIGGWDPLEEDWCDCTRLEKLIDEVLGEFVSEGVLRYNEEKDHWALTGAKISTVISWVAATGGKMPQHLLLELSRDQIAKIPDYISI